MFTILCVDDSKSVHSFIKQCLEGLDILLVFANDGKNALEKVQSASKPFDLILLDWEMPVLNGPDTYEQLKKLKVTSPVMMLTSKNDPDDITRMLMAGVQDYMMKPFTKDILISKVEEISGRTFSAEVKNVAS
ncbi:MAG: PleD family two-component system response regulator [Deltaproteobacteria bacterium]